MFSDGLQADGGAGSGMAKGLERLICGVHRLELISSLTSSVSEATANQPGCRKPSGRAAASEEMHQSDAAACRFFISAPGCSLQDQEGRLHRQQWLKRPQTSQLADCCSRLCLTEAQWVCVSGRGARSDSQRVPSRFKVSVKAERIRLCRPTGD